MQTPIDLDPQKRVHHLNLIFFSFWGGLLKIKGRFNKFINYYWSGKIQFYIIYGEITQL